MRSNYELHKGDVNTLVCQSFSDCYPTLNNYILSDGIQTDSMFGPTLEILNFKIVIKDPLKRCTVALNRNCNIFFHLAESLWVLSGRNDLEFIEIFNSRYKEFSDDGKTLHGAYGKRMRNWNSKNDSETIDQLFKLTSLLNSDPDLRRSVISLWNPSLDLGNPSMDIPCNTQLVLQVKESDFHLTVFNRSNDLHWGYIANIFMFSFLGEIISLLINKHYVRQTHFSKSLHVYTGNNLIHEVAESKIQSRFYSKYPTNDFIFNFTHSTTSFKNRFFEIDSISKYVAEMILTSYKSRSMTLEDSMKGIECFRSKSQSIYEISFFLTLFVNYKKELKSDLDKTKLRMKYADYLLEYNSLKKFRHQDYFGLALNYFVQRMDTKSKSKYILTDTLLGQY